MPRGIRNKPADSTDDLPESIRLQSDYAFWTEEGELRRWSGGQDITNPDDIRLLLERQVELVQE